jgi:hypothetical protein
MNKSWRSILLTVSCLFVFAAANAQEKTEKSDDPNQRKADKKKQEQLDQQARAEEKAKKRHMQIQTKETRKRMRKSAKKARKNNEHKEFILLRPFKKKH